MKTMNKSEERKVTPESGNAYGWYSVKRCYWFALSMLWLLLQLQLPFPFEFGALKVDSLCTKDFCFLLLIGLFGSICRQTS